MNHSLSNAAPFLLDHDEAYLRWRDEKLNNYPETLAARVVEIADPFFLTRGEKERILALCAKTNMALFCVPISQGSAPAAQLLPTVMAQLGVRELDHNLGAGADGLSMLSPGGAAYSKFSEYVPYRETPIGWHTDGYYHPKEHQIRGLSLYCERPAQQGGENDLWDHELAYIRLRDENPEFIRVLMQQDVMSIPPRMEDGHIARPERIGPVFSIHPVDGRLHMRFTNRTKSIRWRQDAAVGEAVAALKRLLDHPTPHAFRGRLEAGWGLISNNVLHTRGAFHDTPGSAKRILYRARYFDRVPVK
ncbi:MAG: TauD/TfdA family dioxygenase [Magnetococcales bacterium]|nr:TauD/TfdA family dioxygenase [Magnetococcales bacterium]